MTYFNDPAIPRFQDPDYYDEAEELCELCDEPLDYGECKNSNCHCQECGEAHDEVDGKIVKCNCTE